MEQRIGCYICTGCGIGETLDIDSLVENGTDNITPAECRTHPALCSEEGLELIRTDIKDGGVNSVVIAACSPRVMTEQFDFDRNRVFVERVNLREQVAWSHEPGDENTQELAEDYVRMGLAKAEKAGVPQPEVEKVNRSLLVVGGGVAGLTAAHEAAQAGYDVYLVEKEAELGGRALRYAKLTPKRPPYNEPAANDVGDLVAKVTGHDKIQVFTGTDIEETSGAPGKFQVTLRNDTHDVLEVGAIIQATGWKPYPAENLSALGAGVSPDVITNVQLEEMAANGGVKRPSDGKAPRRIAFIQCAGSRDADHLPYCSGVCCLVTLKQALYLREQNPESEVYIFYKDVRTPGQYEDFYRRVQEEEGVFFTKGEVTAVGANGNGALTVDAKDTLLGENIRVEADLVVLATGMVPDTVPSRRTPSSDKEAREEAKAEGAHAEATESESEENVAGQDLPRVLNLQYRQGEELPLLTYEFPDSHFICFPYETQRTGIYAAGCVRRPQNLAETIEDAVGAAMKAIQCVEMTARGEAVHPRAGDRTHPDFSLNRCTQCKRCTEECPFGVLDESEDFTPIPSPSRCRRCGVCMGACPERLVSFEDYSVDIVASMIKAIHVPDEFEEKPRVIAFFCENDAYPALDMAGFKHLRFSPYIRVIPVRCLGSVNTVWVADALAAGIDGVLLFGCKSGDDYQCHFIKGSELAGRRSENVQEALDRLVLESDRVRLEEVEITDFERIPQIIDEFMETIDEVGANPYKDF